MRLGRVLYCRCFFVPQKVEQWYRYVTARPKQPFGAILAR